MQRWGPKVVEFRGGVWMTKSSSMPICSPVVAGIINLEENRVKERDDWDGRASHRFFLRRGRSSPNLFLRNLEGLLPVIEDISQKKKMIGWDFREGWLQRAEFQRTAERNGTELQKNQICRWKKKRILIIPFWSFYTKQKKMLSLDGFFAKNWWCVIVQKYYLIDMLARNNWCDVSK